MAYVINCEVCEGEIERGPGRPTSQGARAALCVKCAGVEAQVEETLRAEATKWALETSERLETRRVELRQQLRTGTVPSPFQIQA